MNSFFIRLKLFFTGVLRVLAFAPVCSFVRASGRMPKSFYRYLKLFFAGALLALAFAPLDLKILSLFAPAYLCYDWMRATKDRLFFSGFYFGFGFLSVGVSWVYVSIHYFGHTPVALALLLTFVFVAGLSLLFALQGYFFLYRAITTSITLLLFFPACMGVRRIRS